MRTRIALLLPLVAASALSACTDKPSTDTAAPAAPPTSAAPASAGPPPPPSSKPSTSTGACPVTAATLEKAFKANKEISDNIVLGKGLKDVSCYGGWATDEAQPTNVDPAYVLFEYDQATKAWTAVTAGTDNICGDVPRTSSPTWPAALTDIADVKPGSR